MVKELTYSVVLSFTVLPAALLFKKILLLFNLITFCGFTIYFVSTGILREVYAL